ncbi:hypothetical protein AV530_001539 [Patagioenas fasciata monilis]|uniref:Uncharacterized protein n=1 Tax=Patagioenas fasciata monilis TaxID=372326 RepID=A0A1V4KR48_PATFA|nr:hypothetical protein AV530_001539 [Patagioenas fasciata monilis]
MLGPRGLEIFKPHHQVALCCGSLCFGDSKAGGWMWCDSKLGFLKSLLLLFDVSSTQNRRSLTRLWRSPKKPCLSGFEPLQVMGILRWELWGPDHYRGEFNNRKRSLSSCFNPSLRQRRSKT